jgi:hypothetical protein
MVALSDAQPRDTYHPAFSSRFDRPAAKYWGLIIQQGLFTPVLHGDPVTRTCGGLRVSHLTFLRAEYIPHGYLVTAWPFDIGVDPISLVCPAHCGGLVTSL